MELRLAVQDHLSGIRQLIRPELALEIVARIVRDRARLRLCIGRRRAKVAGT